MTRARPSKKSPEEVCDGARELNYGLPRGGNYKPRNVQVPIDQEMSKFALQFSFSLLVIRKYIVKIRWRFVVVTLDVLKR